MNKELYVYPGVTQEQLEALKDEVLDFSVLATQDIKNNHLEFNEDGEVLVKEGTLLHGTNFRWKDEQKIKSIAANGIITGEFFGAKEKGRTHYHAEFYRANHDMKLKEFLNDDRNLFPKKDNSVVAFLVVESDSTTELFKNNSLDENSNVTEDVRSLVEGGMVYHKDELLNKTIFAIPIGIPANCFSALVVSKDIEFDNKRLSFLHELFPNLYIVNIVGKVIKKPVEDESNE